MVTVTFGKVIFQSDIFCLTPAWLCGTFHNTVCSIHCVLNCHPCIFVISFSPVSRHSTSKLSWSECMDFSDTQTHNITDLRGLKRFLNQGFYLGIEEEKVPKNKLWGGSFSLAKRERAHILALDVLGPVMACSFRRRHNVQDQPNC